MKTYAVRSRTSLLLLGLSLVPLGALADVGAAKTVASGLWNPRGINFAPNGELYVAEAGRGGPGPCIPSPVPTNGNRCYGETGGLAKISPNESAPAQAFERVLTGLPSLVLGDGTVEGGPTDVAFLGSAPYVLLGLGGNPAVRQQLGGKAALLGTLLQATPSGQYKRVADIAGQEAIDNPAGRAIDSNPYGLLVQPGRRIVADAGANALFENLANRQTSVFAVPTIPDGRDSVPTSVVEGPDGAVYVGLLTGGPFWAGTAPVLRIASDGSSIETYAAGFTAIIDIAFDAGGALYVLEAIRGVPPFPPGFGVGRLVRQCPGGARSDLLTGLTFPAGVAIGPDGAAYLTNRGTSPSDGEVLRLPLTPCP
jgi:hypothetical protein